MTTPRDDDDFVPPPDPVMTDRPVSPLSTRFVAIGVMMALVLIAGLTGAAIERLAHRDAGAFHGGPGRGGPNGGGPDGGGPDGRRGGRGGRGPFMELTGDLALTAAQRTAIDSAMSEELQAYEHARESIQPRLDSILRATRQRIDAILTPAQRAAMPAPPAGRGPDDHGRGGPGFGSRGPRRGGGGNGPPSEDGRDGRRGSRPSPNNRP